MIEAMLLYLIAGQPDIQVFIVDDAFEYCHSEAIGCAYLESRTAYVEWGWPELDGIISHEVTHIAMNERGHPDKFFETALMLNEGVKHDD